MPDASHLLLAEASVNTALLVSVSGVATVLMLPTGALLAAGRAPSRWRATLGPVRARGWGLLLLYAAVLANTLPRLVDADGRTVLMWTELGGVLAAFGVLLPVAVTARLPRAPVSGRRR